MQLQLEVNDYKANIFLEFLELFKKDSIVKEYKVLKPLNSYEQEVLEELKELKSSMQEEGLSTGKFIEIE